MVPIGVIVFIVCVHCPGNLSYHLLGTRGQRKLAGKGSSYSL